MLKKGSEWDYCTNKTLKFLEQPHGTGGLAFLWVVASLMSCSWILWACCQAWRPGGLAPLKLQKKGLLALVKVTRRQKRSRTVVPDPKLLIISMIHVHCMCSRYAPL